MRVLYFDCFSGASGDMIVGALIDAGVSFSDLREAILSLKVPGFDVTTEPVVKRGLQATQFHVTIAEDAPTPHRHLHHVIEIINGADLPQAVKEGAIGTFRRVAEAEAAVHGTTIEKVHFHEVGAIDSIVDIVGAHWALDALGVDRVEASPLPLGSGTIKCAHGVIPVLAPATALLVRGVPTYGGDIEGEVLTPTGAALITHMAQAFGPVPAMTVEAIGLGSGTRDVADRANVLRVFLGEVSDAAAPIETVCVIETNVDDMSGELLPPLLQDLLRAGARDAFLTPIVGKKGRPGTIITALCDEAKSAEVARVFFSASTTLGIRMRSEQRICLDRTWKVAQTPYGPVKVKIGSYDGTTTVTAPEFEDCRRVAEEAGVAVRRVYEAALAAAVKGELGESSHA